MPNAQRATVEGMRYRPDIDGLRAIAVIPVVFYHYSVWPFTGGYVGVDVFFVISGYLITSLIHGEMLEGRFSTITFYERRIRRIYPALFFLLTITTVFSFILLLPEDLRRYGASLLATTFFVSNFEFWLESGYFNVTAELKPLIHTWSLAVEEQFYLAFPLLLLLIRNRTRNRLLLIISAISVASFAFSIWAVRSHLDLAFYLAPARVWELLLGGMLALARLTPPKSVAAANVFGISGIGLIACSVCLFSRDTPFPGPAAALPCVGAACVIYAGSSKRSLLNRLLSTGPFVFVGLISYSLYLWHWPVFVFANYYALTGLAWAEKIALITMSIALASLSWRFVESPFRGKNGIVERNYLFGLGAAAMGATASVGLLAFILQGLPSRFSPDLRTILEANVLYNAAPCPSNGHLCLIGSDSSDSHAKRTFLLWGDSLAYALLPAIQLVAQKQDRLGLLARHDGCPPIVGVVRSDNPGCFEFNDAALRVALEDSIQEVILVSRWAINSEGTRYGTEPGSRVVLTDPRTNDPTSDNNHIVFARALEATIQKLRAAGKKIIFVNSTPEIGHPVPDMLAKIKLLHSKLDIAPSLRDYMTRQEFVFATADRMKKTYGISVVDPSVVLCTTDKCVLEIAGKPLYRDYHHLSDFGAMQLVPLLAPVM